MNNDKREYLKKKLKVREIHKKKASDNQNVQFQLTEDSLRFLKSNLLNQWMNRKDSSKFVIIDQSKIPPCSNSN